MPWHKWRVIDMIRYDVKFPAHNPTSPEGLPDEVTWRANLRFKSHLHAPLMRILDAIEGNGKAGHLLDLALTGAYFRYGLTEAVAASVTLAPEKLSSDVSTTKSNPGLSVKATLLERGISSGAIANFMRTPDRQ
jgi:hypothetical protein